MVVVSHLFFFFDKKFGESVTRYESHPPSLELSISRQPLNHCLKRSWLTTVFTKLSGILCTTLAFPRTVILLHSSGHVRF